jgi:hypothetical protein
MKKQQLIGTTALFVIFLCLSVVLVSAKPNDASHHKGPPNPHAPSAPAAQVLSCPAGKTADLERFRWDKGGAYAAFGDMIETAPPSSEKRDHIVRGPSMLLVDPENRMIIQTRPGSTIWHFENGTFVAVFDGMDRLNNHHLPISKGIEPPPPLSTTTTQKVMCFWNKDFSYSDRLRSYAKTMVKTVTYGGEEGANACLEKAIGWQGCRYSFFSGAVMDGTTCSQPVSASLITNQMNQIEMIASSFYFRFDNASSFGFPDEPIIQHTVFHYNNFLAGNVNQLVPSLPHECWPSSLEKTLVVLESC